MLAFCGMSLEQLKDWWDFYVLGPSLEFGVKSVSGVFPWLFTLHRQVIDSRIKYE